MYLFIEALTGLTIRLRVVPDDLIKDIKYKIMICEDLPIDEQHLIFLETDLEDNKTLRDYKIGAGTTLRLIMKMRGGPLSPDMTYDNMCSESDNSLSNNLSDYLAIMMFENGDYKFVPVYGLEKQNIKLQKTKDDLIDEDIFLPIDESLSEHKITILKLKMDYAKLNKKLSSLNLQNNKKCSTPVTNNGEQPIQKKQINNILCRSMSLDSRPTGLVPDVSKLLNRSTNQNTINSLRSPSLGIYKTMSVLDTLRIKKSQNTLPYLKDKEKNRETLQKYSQSFQRNSSSVKLEKNNLTLSRQKLSPVNELEELKKKSTKRQCPVCSIKLTLTNEFSCRCGSWFCTKHRYPETHKCTYDFRTIGQLELIKSNPVIKASKITKI